MRSFPDPAELPGALVISLDFELQWGVRQRMRDGSYRRNLVGAREAIPRMLALFAEFDVSATWATVGFLFARSLAEREWYRPERLPAYTDSTLSPYDDPVGANEAADPLHFAPSLIDAIRATPRQELATHTFSHYYCQEPGQDGEAFRADLAAAIAIARDRDIALTSIVLPRNQYVSAYDAILLESGITAYRGNPPSWQWRFNGAQQSATWTRRVARAADSYVGVGAQDLLPWRDVLQPSGLANVRASRFLAPVRPDQSLREWLRLRRLGEEMRVAATRRHLFHLWWHPHNFGAHVDNSIAFLRRILEQFDRCRSRWGMRSLSMADVSRMARGEVVTARGTSLAKVDVV